jgi:propanol-preferring alcohol dehydrogenase
MPIVLKPASRAAIVALSRESMSFFPYTQLINKEVEIIGVSDHLASELLSLLRYAQSGKLTFPDSALRFVDLDAAQINAALDALKESTAHVRTVIIPSGPAA